MSVIDEKFVLLDIVAGSQREAIAQVVHRASVEGRVRDEAEVVAAVLRREAEGTTGFGKGFAIPHGKSAAVNEPTLLYGRLRHGVEWQAMDDNPVQQLFMILVPESSHQEHLQILAKLARLLMHEDFVEGLSERNSVADVVEFLKGQLQ